MNSKKAFYQREIQKALSCMNSESYQREFLKKSNQNSRWFEETLLLSISPSPPLERIECNMKRWCELQRRDGSFCEIKRPPYAATAFSTIAMCESVIRCQKTLDSDVVSCVEDSVTRAASFLEKHVSEGKANQDAAALLALELAKEVCNKSFETKNKLKTIESLVTKNGFFSEDGGVDIGYCSLTCELLSWFCEKSDNKKLYDKILDVIKNLSYFMYPDGTVGGDYNTRTKGWFILDGFERVAKESQVAGAMALRHIEAHENGLCNATHLPNNRHIATDGFRLALALENSKKSVGGEIPADELNWKKRFDEGIMVVRKPKFMAIVGANGFGVWSKNKLFVNLSNENSSAKEGVFRFDTHSLQNSRVSFSLDRIEVEGNAHSRLAIPFSKSISKIWSPTKTILVKRVYDFSKGFSVNVIMPENIRGCEVFGSLGEGNKKVNVSGNVFYDREDFNLEKVKFEKYLNYKVLL